MKPLAPNTLLQNRYLIVNLIGKGGMGEVYLAVDQRLGSAIALKRTFFSDDEMLRNAFEQEARTLARLRHGVLPKVSDHFTEEGTQYLIMEHIAGDDLAKRLELTQKPFPLSWVLFWADQLLDALNYLHSHEPPIIHRDIKPQNLKLTDDNSIVLLDFGLSKNSTGNTKINTTGSIVGFTPHYAPMEQVRGIGTDARSDIYSLSATFYQLLTNVVPPDALSRADFIISGLADPIKPINEINLEVTPLVSEILLKGMEVSLERRFPNARVMQKALREAFAQLQNGMFAETFPIIPDNQQEVKVVPLAPLETELTVKPPRDFSTPIQTEDQDKTEAFHLLTEDQEKTVEFHFDTNLTQKPTDEYSTPLPNTPAEEPDFYATLVDGSPLEDLSPKQTEEPDFYATLMDNKPIKDLSLKQNESPLGDLFYKQADVKTEVFLADSTPEFTAAKDADFSPPQNFDTNDEFARKDIFPQTDNLENDFAATNNFAKEENVLPFSTVPLFTADDKEDADKPGYVPSDSMNFDSIEPAEDYSDASTNYAADEDYSPAKRTDAPPIAPTPPPAKSNRKALIIVGVLSAFFIFLMSAAGLGFYLYQNSGTTVEKTTPRPTAEPTVEASTPTPEPTLEAVTNTNSSTNSSTNTNISNDNSSITNTANTNTKQPVTAPTVRTTETPRPVKTVEPPPPTVRPTQRPTPQTTTPRPTPKPTIPKKTPLPRILP